MQTSDQKTLKHAFYMTVFLVGVNLFTVFLTGAAGRSPLATFEWFALPVLGYLTMKQNYIASKALLALFLFDRIALLNNWISYMSQSPTGTITFVLLSFWIWGYFYRASLVIKRLKETHNKLTVT